MRTKICSLFVAGLMAASSALAANLFEVTGTDGIITKTVSSSNVLDLIQSTIENTSLFPAGITNADLTFLGVPKAMSYSLNPAGTSATLNIPSISFTRTFTGANRDAVYVAMEDFLKTDGSSVLSRFLKEMAKQSAVAVTDGNPNASTAIAAKGIFMSEGFTPADQLTFEGDSPRPNFGGFGIGFNSGRFDADVAGKTFSGEFAELGLTWLNLGLGDRVRLLAPFSASYLTIDNTAVYGVGQSLSLPIRILIMDKTNPWNWRLTPVGGISARASIDALSGAVIWHAGLVNSIDYRVNHRLIVCLVNQLTTHQGLPVKYGSYSFDSEIDQLIAKNGIRLVTPLTKRLIGDVYFIDTRFLNAAAVKQFETVGASISLRATKKYKLSLASNYDFGNNYKAYSVGLSSAWSW